MSCELSDSPAKTQSKLRSTVFKIIWQRHIRGKALALLASRASSRQLNEIIALHQRHRAQRVSMANTLSIHRVPGHSFLSTYTLQMLPKSLHMSQQHASSAGIHHDYDARGPPGSARLLSNMPCRAKEKSSKQPIS